ncbi:PKD domain-containing protein [Microbulbifer sp. MCCC 1A16149]|uniref:PKD domain-containing protein n=1 Tax=Microbulbifer sp. MCCC 1A16149 TaxID=3411322 RepID=UPI003D0A21B0
MINFKKMNLATEVAKVCRPVLQASLFALCASSVQGAPQEEYSWKNVRIDGGGFIPGIIFNRTEPNLIYTRTDIGGAYRWNEANQEWVPLLDWVGWDNWGWNGVMSMATDPVDTDRVYAALGMYTNDWDPNNGAIARSTDRGETWQVTQLPFKVGGNMPGRGMGERLRIDPNDNSTIYYGAELGEGLWRSTDYGVTWYEVQTFPNSGTYAADPDDEWGYGDKLQGVVWVTFDPSSGTSGEGSDVIYVGVADKAHSLYRSTDGGTSWEVIPGAPSGLIPHKGVYDEVNGELYVAMSDTGGPYDGETGAVWKFDSATETWTEISPMTAASGELYFGYSGLTIDRQNPDTLMVASLNSWWPDMILFRTTDGGDSWTRIWDWAGYPTRSKRYEMDISSVPWLHLGANPQPPEEALKLGWMNESIEIDPHNSDRFMYGTGATIYGSQNLTDWDSDGTVIIEPMIKGVEETAVLDLASPPSGTANIFSALGDIGGFKHVDVDAVPELMYQTPYLTSTTGIDFAALDPSIMVRVGNADTVHLGVSSSSGDSWWQGQEPAGVTGGGNVAMSADGGAIVWSPVGAGVHVSTTYGSSWTASSGVPEGARVESDRVNPQVFYAFSGGTFYVSTDGGNSFAATAASGLPESGKFLAAPGLEGHIWLAGSAVNASAGTVTGVWRSTDGGASFDKLTSVDEGVNIGLGAAAPGSDYQTLYLVGTVDGETGVFRSTNEGAGWVRINDDAHQYGNMGEAITGDPRIYGRVYLGTNGRGLLYADPTGAVVENAEPVAAASATPVSGDAPLLVSFDGSSSSDADGDALSYSWSFGDGASATGATASHTYQSAGNFTATLTVNDGRGGTDTASVVITANGVEPENTSPVAVAAVSATSGEAPLAVTFDAAGSSDADGDALTYSWNFGDGSTGTGVNVAHTYTEAGEYTASLTVNDGAASSSDSLVITVSAADGGGDGGGNDGGGTASCEYIEGSHWGAGFTGSIRITNNGAAPIDGWTLTFAYSGSSRITNLWNANLTGSNPYSATGFDWNSVIQPGAYAEFGYQGEKSTEEALEIPSISGSVCE